jgi:hypothetical protein
METGKGMPHHTFRRPGERRDLVSERATLKALGPGVRRGDGWGYGFGVMAYLLTGHRLL